MYFKGRSVWDNARLDEDSVLRSRFKDENLSVFIVDIDPKGSGEDDGRVVAYSCELLRSGTGDAVSGGKRKMNPLDETVHPSQVVESKQKGPTFLVVSSRKVPGPCDVQPTPPTRVVQ